MKLEEIINQYTNYLYTTITNISYGNLSTEDIEEIEEIISDTFYKRLITLLFYGKILAKQIVICGRGDFNRPQIQKHIIKFVGAGSKPLINIIT